MTHDELLAKINNLPETIGLAEFKVRHDALLAVVELHKPSEELFRKVEFMSGIEANYSVCEYCNGLIDNPKITVIYPCRTIQTIEKELL